MNETITMLIGLYAMYTWGHFTIMSFKIVYKDRTSYEKFVTWCAIVTMVLFIIGAIS